jgi:hypothetical protein
MQDEVNEVNEVNETQPTIEPVEGSEEQAAVSEERPISEVSLPVIPLGAPKPRSNIFTLLLIVSFLCVFLAVYLVAHELNKIYGVTFGGILSPPPQKISETTEPGK